MIYKDAHAFWGTGGSVNGNLSLIVLCVQIIHEKLDQSNGLGFPSSLPILVTYRFFSNKHTQKYSLVSGEYRLQIHMTSSIRLRHLWRILHCRSQHCWCQCFILLLSRYTVNQKRRTHPASPDITRLANQIGFDGSFPHKKHKTFHFTIYICFHFMKK